MSFPAYFVSWPAVEKIEGLNPEQVKVYLKRNFASREDQVVVAPPDYPQLAEGLEIGALYDLVSGPDGPHSCMNHLSSYYEDNHYIEWCEKLVSLVTKGKKLKGGPYRMVDWSNALSELVQDRDKYPDTEGRGPFWELLRYGLRGMTFGPVACRKLAADFEKWESDVWASRDFYFLQMYLHLQRCFNLPDGTCMVTYPESWYEDDKPFTEPKLGMETLKLLEAAEIPRYNSEESDGSVREYDDI
jgi:hypothetical protein